jgi:sugar phosphate permease
MQEAAECRLPPAPHAAEVRKGIPSNGSRGGGAMVIGGSRFSLRNRWLRILGVALVMYVLATIDRGNIAMAIPAMRQELGLSPAAIGFATSTFFWGYLVLQIPAGRIASVWRPKWVILVLVVCWSCVSLTTAFVDTELELILNRFALGLSEGGVLTCTLVLIRAWFTRAERARANAIFLLSLAAGPIFASPLSGLILSYSTWRWMFIIEAAPGLVWAMVWCFAIDDDPRRARWLDAVERAQLTETLDAEKRQMAAPEGHWLATLWHPAVIFLALYNFFALMAEWGVNLWFPTVLKETGLSIGVVGLLSAAPHGLGMVAMLLVAMSSDRLHERKWHMIAATTVSGLALILMPLGGGSSLAAVCFLTVAIGAFLGRFGPFWTLPTEVLPPAVLGVGIGLINGMGNLGGTVGPTFFGYARTATGSFSLALTVAGASLMLSSLIALPLRPRRATDNEATLPDREMAAVLQPQMQKSSAS